MGVTGAMDIHHHRSDCSEPLAHVLAVLYAGHVLQWTSLEETAGLWIRFTLVVRLSLHQ